MPISLNNTQVVYNDSTTQTTAAQASFTGTNQSLAVSGYQRLPGGLIIQWGTTATTNQTVTFPITFPTACRSVVSVGTAGGSGRESRVNGVGTVTFNLGSDACCVNNSVPASWIAIGY